MTTLTSELIEKIVREQIVKGKDEIGISLTNGTERNMTYEEIYVKMFFNSIEISAQLSVKIVMELLYQSGLVSELDTKSLLKQLSSFQEE